MRATFFARVGSAVSQRCPVCWVEPAGGFAPCIRLALFLHLALLSHLALLFDRNGLGFCCGIALLPYETLPPAALTFGTIVSHSASSPHLCPGLISTPLVPARMVVRLIWKKKFSVFCLAPVFGRDGLVFYRRIALCVL